jgi:hypothetical protein
MSFCNTCGEYHLGRCIFKRFPPLPNRYHQYSNYFYKFGEVCPRCASYSTAGFCLKCFQRLYEIKETIEHEKKSNDDFIDL